ncbi:MAG: DUF3391 domain-containing protein [Gammaproteobacteria bacterium]|nr:DUF3391 domain-containing protein [Gammaproteobacteria bacterium]
MKRKIDAKDIEIGMYIAELDRPWLESPFLFQGFAVTSQGDINELERCCKYVLIDEDRSNYEKAEPLSSRMSMKEHGKKSKTKFVRPAHLISVEKELSKAQKVRKVAEKQVSSLMQQARVGKALDIKQANSVVGDIIESLVRSPDAMVLLGSMKSHGNDAEAHAINTSILAITLGRFMKFSHEIIEELGIAALLHDVGEVKVPTELIGNGAKTPEEIALVRKHTTFGAEILRNTKGIARSAVDVAYSHHEQVDGNGYPRKLTVGEISIFVKIVSIVDTYDMLTRGNGDDSISATEALRYLYLYRDKIFDGKLTEVFIKCLGIYPVGSLVELETGEVGIVVSVQPGALLLPTLLLVKGRDKKSYEKPLIMNLATFAKNEPNKYVVKQVLPPDAYGIDMRSFLLSAQLI